MRAPVGILALLLWILKAVPVAAGEPPTVIHGHAAVQVNSLGTVFEVESDQTQVRLSRDLVVTAGKGTAFEVFPPLLGDGSEMLHVTRGRVVLIDERGDRAEAIFEGGRLAYGSVHQVPPDGAAEQARPRENQMIAAPTRLEDAYTQWQQQEGRQGFVLSDSVMTRQQEYLSSLKIDIMDLNRALSSFIRRLLF